MLKRMKRSNVPGIVVNGQQSNDGGSQSVVPNKDKWFKLPSPVAKKLVVIAVVIVVAAAGVFAYIQTNNDTPETPAATSNESDELSPAFKQLYEDDKKAIEAKLAAAQTPDERSAAYVEYANLESGEDHLVAALDYAKKAVDEKESIDSLVALGFQAERFGNYALAAESYGKAAELAKQVGGEEGEYDYQVYMSMKEQAEQNGGQ